VVVALTMGATVFFQVETVAVSGNSRYTEEEIVQVTGIKIGDNLYRLNKNQIALQLLQELPYVENVTIRRSLPSTIVITVTEWDAVARVVSSEDGEISTGSTEVEAVVEQDEEPTEQQEDAAVQTQAGGLVVAPHGWLISVSGKLLEPAPADSTVMTVTGLTPLLPREGTKLEVSQEEQPKLEGLKALLAELEAQEMLGQVSAIQLTSTQAVFRYRDQFEVKVLLNADFHYKLRALLAAAEETEKKLGAHTTGTFDLTQEGYTAIYTPD
jgi:cell division protein FtsQ